MCSGSGTFVVGFGSGLLWVFSTQLMLELSPEGVRGRVMATEFAFFTLASAAGAATAGMALDRWLGIGELLRWMAMLSLVPASFWALWTAATAGRLANRTRRSEGPPPH